MPHHRKFVSRVATGLSAPRTQLRFSLTLFAAFATLARAEPLPPQGVPASDRTSRSSAQDVAAVAAESDQKNRDDYQELTLAASLLPNERYRIEGAWAAANGRWAEAARQFRLAARYADKYSQHRLSMLYWYGVGVQRDPVEAYLWADLAAERGYPQFLAIREKMWAELTPRDQTAVPSRGDALYREFGDPVAKRRLNDALGQAKHKITGSRTGFIGTLGVSAMQGEGLLPNLFDNAAVASIYRKDRLDPNRYWEIEDRIWKNAKVRVGDFETTTLHSAASSETGKTDAKP